MTQLQSPPSGHPARTTDSTADRTTARPWLALSVLVLAVVLLAVDGTVLSLAIPALARDLDPSAVQMLWIGDVYSYALAGLLVTMGGVADRLGRRRVLMIGSTAFGVASLLAGLAPTAELLIAARAAQGVAAATLMPSTLSMIRDLFPDAKRRTRAIAIWAAAAYGGAALGPLLGGALLEHFWWGSVFVINVPIVAVLVVGARLVVPESRGAAHGPFDVVGAGLSLCAVVPVTYALKEAMSHGVDGPSVAALVAGLVAAVSFVRRQNGLVRRGRQPLIDGRLFRSPSFSGAVVATFVAVFAFSGLLYFFSQYLQLVRGHGAFGAGLRELPLTVAAIAVVPVAGPLARRLGYGAVIGAGLLLAGASMALLAAAESSSGYALLAVALALAGVGEGFVLTLGTDAVLSSVPRENAAAASAVSETAYELGVASGIAVLGSAMTTLYRAGLDGESPAVRESLAGAVSHGSGHEIAAAMEAFVGAMQAVSLVAGFLLLVSGVVAWRFIKAEPGRERAAGRR